MNFRDRIIEKIKERVRERQCRIIEGSYYNDNNSIERVMHLTDLVAMQEILILVLEEANDG